ncbi:MAG: hypothetical protein JXB07_02625 [Anaerolineae bacterium]|nr:hypothetical protein [Anaerolineae bacterium]
MGKDPQLQEALRLARAGEKEPARRLLIEILRRNRDDFDAWIVMAQVAEDRREAITSTRQALRLRPDDERVKRYLEHLLQEERSDTPESISPWLWGGVGATLIALLAVIALLILPRLGLGAAPGEDISGAQPPAQPPDCTTLINDALEISDQGCRNVGRNQVCYGHNTVQAQLIPGADARFDQPGSTIPIDILASFMASPLDTQKGDWGVGVFKLEANLPGTLPGQLVTMLVFGNTSLRNGSGDMQAFYFTSSLGGIQCDAVPFDGILVRMAEGAGVAFRANGTDVILEGSSLLRAFANDKLTVTTLSGTGTVSAHGRSQELGTGQTVTVPLGGDDGMNADGPPSEPVQVEKTMLSLGCALTGQNCPEDRSVARAATNTPVPVDPGKPTNTPVPVDPGKPTNTPVPALPGQPTNTPVPLPTNTPEPLPTNTPVPAATKTNKPGSSTATNTPKPGATNTYQPTVTKTNTPYPTNTPTKTPTSTYTPTNTPAFTHTPTTTNTVTPTDTPSPTATTPPPTVDVCSTIGLSWGGISNKRVTIDITSGGAINLETVYVSWPSDNGELKKINEKNVNAAPPSTTVTLSMSVNDGTSIIFMFENGATEPGYVFTLTFSGGCIKTLNH